MILTVLACLNVLLYGAAGGLLYAYVLAPPAEPAGPLLVTSAPTLRPTFTPTWTSTPMPAMARTLAPLPTRVPAATPTPTTPPMPTVTPTETPLPTETPDAP